MTKYVRIRHRESGTLIADGPLGWRSIMPFEGNYYIARRHLKTEGFRPNYIPGLCPYKFLYVWMDLRLGSNTTDRSLGWMYWLPNPLLPFIWYRVAVGGTDPRLEIEEYVANE